MKKTKTVGLLLLLSSLIATCHANFIVPEELQSILSVVYSTIPQVKKGTDSRVGFGFRFGEHADFQVQLEIGPQIYTQTKYGEQFKPMVNTKRDATEDDYNQSTSKKQQQKDWLQNWSNDAKAQKKQQYMDDVMPTIMQQPTISENALKQLVQLYGKQQDVVPQPIGTQQASQMTEFKFLPVYPETKTRMVLVTPRSKAQKEKITADLSDVDLD